MSDLDARPPSRRLWVIAALCAAILHAGGIAAAVFEMQAEESDDALGAPSIEIGLEMMAPRSEVVDAPPGPDSEATAASTAVAEQKAVEKETDLPKAVPQESADPDLVVTENNSKKPVEEEPEKAAVQQEAAQEAVATEAMAMPSSETAKEGPRSVAPAQGNGNSDRRVKVAWQKELVAHLNKHLKYPEERDNKPATVSINLEIDRVGHVLAVSIAKSSGDPAFDQAALAMARRSDPVPRPPPVTADEGLSFNLPVIFSVKDAAKARARR
ncbi:MAG: TonB family protein [Tardiphaga sp.]